MSAQKAFQGSETETRELLGGTEEKSASSDKVSLICPPGKSMIFIKKVQAEKKLSSGPDLLSSNSTWRQSLGKHKLKSLALRIVYQM